MIDKLFCQSKITENDRQTFLPIKNDRQNSPYVSYSYSMTWHVACGCRSRKSLIINDLQIVN